MLVIAIVVVALTYITLNHYAAPKVPPGKRLPPTVYGIIPFIGPGIEFGKNPVEYAQQQYKKFGDVFTLKLMGKRLTFLVGPEAHTIFFKSTDEELNQEEPYRFCVPIFGPGVVYDVPLNIRVQQMKMVTKSLSEGRLKVYVEQIVEETEQYFSQWPNDGEIDIKDELSQLIILTASRTLMGKEIRTRLHKEIAAIYQTLDEGLTGLSVIFPNAPIPAHWRRNRAREKMVQIFTKIMKERLEHPEVQHNDVLQVFMDARYKDNDRPLTSVEVSGLMIALLFAGQHTSSISGSWTGLRLIRDKDLLNRVIQEQEKIIAENGTELNWETLNKMDLLYRCIKEAIRMNPPLIMLMRKTLHDFEVKDMFIPTGDILFVSPNVSMRLPSVYSNPDVYDPDRYAPPRSEDKSVPYAYLGFGGGRHECMGQQFALTQLRTIWAVLLRTFDFEAVGPLPVPDYSGMVVGPTHPAKLRFKRKIPKK